MSESPSNASPISHACPEAVLIDLKSPDTAAQSLCKAHDKFQGKILFFKEEIDEHSYYFAIAEDKRPIFFWEQLCALFSCGSQAVPHYANRDVGYHLSTYFGEHGKQLKKQMNTSWLKRKQAVDSKEFVANSVLDRVAQRLDRRARELYSSMRSSYEAKKLPQQSGHHENNTDDLLQQAELRLSNYPMQFSEYTKTLARITQLQQHISAANRTYETLAKVESELVDIESSRQNYDIHSLRKTFHEEIQNQKERNGANTRPADQSSY